jgi:hypothetical protein
VYNPDKYCIREICIYHITQGAEPMTPQEELFAKLFNHGKLLVKDLDALELRAKREEWAKIAFEARAYITAADDEENERKKAKRKENGNKPTGFERSLNTDETTTDAINTIKERQKRMSKQDRIIESMKKAGIPEADAEKLLSPGLLLEKIKQRAKEEEEKKKADYKPVFNPFEKKDKEGQ